MRFKYRGYNSESVLLTGKLDAENYSAAYSALEFQGVTVVSLLPDEEKFSEVAANYFFKFKLGRRWTAIFFRELSVMLGVMNLHEALEVLKKSSTGQTSEKILNEFSEAIGRGETFAMALKHRENIFGADVVQSVEIAEIGGTLQEITLKLAEQIERSYSVERKVKSALYYPAVVFLAAIVAAFIMINMTLPVFETFYAEQGSELPFITFALINGGKFLKENIFLILILFFAGTIFIFFLYRRSFTFKYFCDKMKLDIKIFREIELRNFFGRLSFLLESGINLDAALKMIEQSTDNEYIKKIFGKIYISITHGEKFESVLKKNLKKISPLYHGLILTGEESGELVKMLRHCEAMLDFEIDEKLRELPAKAEVFGTLVAGVIVALLVFSVVLPILSFTDFM